MRMVDRTQLALALPKHLTPERQMRLLQTSLRRTPKLLECRPDTIVKCVMEASQMGFECDGVLGHAYLVPYGSECQLLVGYKGLMQLAWNSGRISSVAVECVREGDHFRYELGTKQQIEHVPNLEDADRDGKPITFVYAVVRLHEGGVIQEAWSRAKVEQHAKRHSQAYAKSTSPWQTHWEWMAKKTVLRQALKLAPVSVEIQRMVARDELIEASVMPTEQPVRAMPRSLEEFAKGD